MSPTRICLLLRNRLKSFEKRWVGGPDGIRLYRWPGLSQVQASRQPMDECKLVAAFVWRIDSVTGLPAESRTGTNSHEGNFVANATF